MMPKQGKPAHLEIFEYDAASKMAGEVPSSPKPTAAERVLEEPLLIRLGNASLELVRNIGGVGKIAIQGNMSELAAALRRGGF